MTAQGGSSGSSSSSSAPSRSLVNTTAAVAAAAAAAATAAATANSRSSAGPSPSSNGEVPKCQGCNERVAQFVCAGCSSQWYCSRECQVMFHHLIPSEHICFFFFLLYLIVQLLIQML